MSPQKRRRRGPERVATRSGLVAGVALSLVLHALLLLAFQGRVRVDPSLFEAARPPSIEITLRAHRPSDAREDDGKVEARPAARAPATKKAAREPAAPAVQAETSPDHG